MQNLYPQLHTRSLLGSKKNLFDLDHFKKIQKLEKKNSKQDTLHTRYVCVININVLIKQTYDLISSFHNTWPS